MLLGFGIAGAVDHAIVRDLAGAAESAGYASFWANDTPNGDGLAALTAAQSQTSSIELGVGVVPIDRMPAAEIAAHAERLGLDQTRLTIGIGSGGIKRGAVDAVRVNTLQLGQSTRAKVVVGALGPRMCRLAGEAADGVLLNWLTPAMLNESAALVRSAAETAGRSVPWIGAYVRVALHGAAEERLQNEASRYEQFPAYAAHFDRMGVRAIDTCVVGSSQAIGDGLAAFTGIADLIVVRAIADSEQFDAYVRLLEAAAPKDMSAR